MKRDHGATDGVSAWGALWLGIGAGFIAFALAVGLGLAGVLLGFGLVCLFFGWLWI